MAENLDENVGKYVCAAGLSAKNTFRILNLSAREKTVNSATPCRFLGTYIQIKW